VRFLSIVKSAENQGPPPQALLDAIAKLTEDSLKDGSHDRGLHVHERVEEDLVPPRSRAELR